MADTIYIFTTAKLISQNICVVNEITIEIHKIIGLMKVGEYPAIQSEYFSPPVNTQSYISMGNPICHGYG